MQKSGILSNLGLNEFSKDTLQLAHKPTNSVWKPEDIKILYDRKGRYTLALKTPISDLRKIDTRYGDANVVSSIRFSYNTIENMISFEIEPIDDPPKLDHDLVSSIIQYYDQKAPKLVLQNKVFRALNTPKHNWDSPQIRGFESRWPQVRKIDIYKTLIPQTLFNFEIYPGHEITDEEVAIVDCILSQTNKFDLIVKFVVVDDLGTNQNLVFQPYPQDLIHMRSQINLPHMSKRDRDGSNYLNIWIDQGRKSLNLYPIASNLSVFDDYGKIKPNSDNSSTLQNSELYQPINKIKSILRGIDRETDDVVKDGPITLVYPILLVDSPILLLLEDPPNRSRRISSANRIFYLSPNSIAERKDGYGVDTSVIIANESTLSLVVNELLIETTFRILLWRHKIRT